MIKNIRDYNVDKLIQDKKFVEERFKYEDGAFGHCISLASIYDLKEKKLYLIRDRVGIKPLYYSLFNGLLVFSSEILGIINHTAFKRSVNFNALASYLSFRYPLGKNNNLFPSVAVTPVIDIAILLKVITVAVVWFTVK